MGDFERVRGGGGGGGWQMPSPTPIMSIVPSEMRIVIKLVGFPESFNLQM